MCDHDNGVILFKLYCQILDLGSGDRVQGRCGLIHKKHLRLYCQGTGNAETLLLSACGNTKGKEMVDASTQTAPPVEGVTALALCDGDVTLHFEKDETGAWTWFDDPAFPLDQTALEDLLALPAALDSGETVGDVQELAVYGLEAPKKYITVTSDGVDVAYYLGDQATDGRWYVLTPAGTVRYTSEENKMLLSRSIYAMAVLPVLPVIEPDRLVSVSLLRADGTAAVSFYTAEDGTRRSANRDVTEKTAALADEIAALTLTACVDYDPAEGAAAVCGLDTPEVTLTVNYLADNSAERTLILAVGLSTGDGGRYVALDGDTTIYRMEESSLTQILTLSETGL